MATRLLKLLLLVTLILNGTGAHGINALMHPTAGSVQSADTHRDCPSAADRGDPPHRAPQAPDTSPARDAPAGHDCGGIGCTCVCVNQTPALAICAFAPMVLPGAASILIPPRVGFHSLTPPPLLRPPID